MKFIIPTLCLSFCTSISALAAPNESRSINFSSTHGSVGLSPEETTISNLRFQGETKAQGITATMVQDLSQQCIDSLGMNAQFDIADTREDIHIISTTMYYIMIRVEATCISANQ